MKYLSIILIIILTSCTNKTRKEALPQNEKNVISDTLIGEAEITNEIAGSSYRNRATGYFVIIEKDTSKYMPVFTESKENGSVSIIQNLPYSKSNTTYSQRLKELKLILQRAEQNYNLDSLTNMSLGRLVLSGDLAVTLTKELESTFGDKEKITTTEYREISDSLMQSTLAKDLNMVFKPYLKSVKKISVEKVFFTSKKELMRYSNITRDSTQIPENIIDFTTWVEFENK